MKEKRRVKHRTEAYRSSPTISYRGKKYYWVDDYLRLTNVKKAARDLVSKGYKIRIVYISFIPGVIRVYVLYSSKK